MGKKKRIVIIGATSAIAEHCARLWISGKSIDLTLVGRDFVRSERVAMDLRVRSPNSDIRVVQADFLDPILIQKTVDTIVLNGPVDLLLIAHGFLPEQSTCQTDLTICSDALTINGISPILYAEAFALHMVKLNHGTIILLGSVAGERGRKSNYIYGAAKGMIARYAQGLQHRVGGTKVNVVLIKPGPTDTPMTAHLKIKNANLAPVKVVARTIVDSVDRGRAVVYAPGKWQLIMWVIRNIPSFIFKKMNI